MHPGIMADDLFMQHGERELKFKIMIFIGFRHKTQTHKTTTLPYLSNRIMTVQQLTLLNKKKNIKSIIKKEYISVSSPMLSFINVVAEKPF